MKLSFSLFQFAPSIRNVQNSLTPTHEKSNIIYKFSCHRGSGYVGKTSQRFHFRQIQHVPNIVKKQMAGGGKPEKSYFLQLVTICWITQIVQQTTAKVASVQLPVLVTSFELHTLELIFIQTLKPELCKQKKFVY